LVFYGELSRRNVLLWNFLWQAMHHPAFQSFVSFLKCNCKRPTEAGSTPGDDEPKLHTVDNLTNPPLKRRILCAFFSVGFAATVLLLLNWFTAVHELDCPPFRGKTEHWVTGKLVRQYTAPDLHWVLSLLPRLVIGGICDVTNDEELLLSYEHGSNTSYHYIHEHHALSMDDFSVQIPPENVILGLTRTCAWRFFQWQCTTSFDVDDGKRKKEREPPLVGNIRKESRTQPSPLAAFIGMSLLLLIISIGLVICIGSLVCCFSVTVLAVCCL